MVADREKSAATTMTNTNTVSYIYLTDIYQVYISQDPYQVLSFPDTFNDNLDSCLHIITINSPLNRKDECCSTNVVLSGIVTSL